MSFQDFKFIPYFNGRILGEYTNSFSLNGALIFARVQKSLEKLTLDFKNLFIEDRNKLTLNTIFESLMIPSISQELLITSNSLEEQKMRNKIIKIYFQQNSYYFNYLENYRISKYILEYDSGLSFQFCTFLFSIPKELREQLVQNISFTGDFCLIRCFVQRILEEIKSLIENSLAFKHKESLSLIESF